MYGIQRRGIGTLANPVTIAPVAIGFLFGLGLVASNRPLTRPTASRAVRFDVRPGPVPHATTPASHGYTPAQLQVLATLGVRPAASSDHPLVPLIRWANAHLDRIRAIDDYDCIFHKQEQIDGVLQPRQVMYVKIRHRPFSVYARYLAPSGMSGCEALYVAGRNEGKLQVHATGLKRLAGTRSIAPCGALAMDGNRYPVTELGLLRLVERFIEVGNADLRSPDCRLDFRMARVDAKPCAVIEVTHAVKEPRFLFHLCRIYIDTAMQLPIRYEAYDWPAAADSKPQLLEAYTYQKLRLNQGFTDADFDANNPPYHFY